ncbi:A-kinase anchor protein 1, mitochondrial [Periplaneta americana]|uniref:A-kinase anchor protein 1, mitochondrial n=1 Tax=Periplaneta americana TaxID=6978 RepID=UPI0037E747F9
MAPNSSRQLLVWSLPTLAFLLSLLWYRRKRGASLRSDPGGTPEDTASTSKVLSPQPQDQVSVSPCVSADKACAKEQLCEIVAIVHSDIKFKIDKPRTSSPNIGQVDHLPSQEYTSELVSEDPVQSMEASDLCAAVQKEEVDEFESYETNKFDTEKEGDTVEKVHVKECRVDKIEVFPLQKIPAESTVERETKISTLEISVCNDLENLEHSTDKISEEHSCNIEGKEGDEIRIKNLNSLINISPQELSESSHLLQGVCDFPTVCEPLQRTVETDVEELEVSPVTVVSCEEISSEFEVANFRIEEDDRETGVKESCEESSPISSLNASISEDLRSVESVAKDIDSVIVACDETSSSAVVEDREVEENSSVSSVESVPVTASVMARKSSTETSTMEKHSHEDDSAKKSSESVTQQESESVSLECKLSTLELESNATGEVSSDVDNASSTGAVAGSFTAASEQQRTERDSANHSPADVMLASPSISSYSDAQSEGSSDSGKGCSDVPTPPSRTPASGSSLSGDVPLPSVYEFVLPQHLVGRLIGRHGCFVHQIKAKTNASILIKRHPDTHKLKICAVEGTQADIDSALEMIRQKFPVKRYPNVTLEQVCFLPPVPTFPLIPECLQLQLVEGVNNDVILSSLVSPAHFFLQQPTHPTFPALNRLNACMNVCYSEPTAPPLPTPTQAGVICVAPTMGGWYRAQVVAVDAETDACDIKFVDYGGYLTVDNSVLRQIRSDFMTLPFQAAECYLANVAPVGGEEALWSKESIAGMEELTHGQVLQAQVCGYAEDSLPVVYLYAIHGSQVVLVNQELVSRGLAEWVETPEA